MLYERKPNKNVIFIMQRKKFIMQGIDIKSVMKRILLVSCCFLFISMTAKGQGFVYFQSENNNPFYLKIGDSLISSNASGYKVLHNLPQGEQIVIVGLAKKDIPEAAFSISVKEKGSKGFLIQKNSGALRLENIQNNNFLKPVKTALSAGSRLALNEKEKELIKRKAVDAEEGKEGNKGMIAQVTPAEKEDTSPPQEEKNGFSFDKMLNAVTGDASDAQSTQGNEMKKVSSETLQQSENKEKTDDLLTEEEKSDSEGANSIFSKMQSSDDNKEKKNKASISDNNTQTEPIVASHQDKKTKNNKKNGVLGAFDKLLQKGKNVSLPKSNGKGSAKHQDTPQEEPTKSETKESVSDLSFLDFDNVSTAQSQEDTASVMGNAGDGSNLLPENDAADNRRSKKGISFDDLLAKIDTASNSSDDKSIAHPLLKESRPVADNNCNGLVSHEELRKLKSQIASKRSDASMLRAFNHNVPQDKCLTINQIQEMAYLYPSNKARLQFLQTAYPHCNNKKAYKKLSATLSSQKYKKRFKALFH